MSQSKKALLLLVHGSRDPAWMAPFEELRAAVAARLPGVLVRIACLQFCPPTVEEALAALADEGAREVVVAPVFISARGHVLRDVPGQVDQAREKFPALEVTISEAVGEIEAVREAMRDTLAGLLD